MSVIWKIERFKYFKIFFLVDCNIKHFFLNILCNFSHKINIVGVRTKKSDYTSPLRTLSDTVQPWPKSIEFVREGIEQQGETLLEDRNREEKVNLIK